MLHSTQAGEQEQFFRCTKFTVRTVTVNCCIILLCHGLFFFPDWWWTPLLCTGENGSFIARFKTSSSEQTAAGQSSLTESQHHLTELLGKVSTPTRVRICVCNFQHHIEDICKVAHRNFKVNRSLSKWNTSLSNITCSHSSWILPGLWITTEPHVLNIYTLVSPSSNTREEKGYLKRDICVSNKPFQLRIRSRSGTGPQQWRTGGTRSQTRRGKGDRTQFQENLEMLFTTFHLLTHLVLKIRLRPRCVLLYSSALKQRDSKEDKYTYILIKQRWERMQSGM